MGIKLRLHERLAGGQLHGLSYMREGTSCKLLVLVSQEGDRKELGCHAAEALLKLS